MIWYTVTRARQEIYKRVSCLKESANCKLSWTIPRTSGFLPAQDSSCEGRSLDPARTWWAFLSQLVVLYHVQTRETFCKEHHDSETPRRYSVCPLYLVLHPCCGIAEASSPVSAAYGDAWQLQDLKWNVWNWSLEVLKVQEVQLPVKNMLLVTQICNL
jgi:hypothetical protein